MRSLLVVASITVGLFAIGVIATIYMVIAEDMRTGYSAVNAANIFIQADLFDRDVVNHLRHVPGVRQAEGVRRTDLRVLTGPDEWASIEFKAFPEIDSQAINQLTLVQGVWPPKDEEVVVDQYKLKDLHAQVGDAVRIELPSGKVRTLKLVGVVQDLTIGAFSGGGGFFHAPVQAYTTMKTLDKLEQPNPDLLSGVYLTVTGDGGNEEYVRSVANRVGKELEAVGVNVTSNTARSSYDHPNGYLVDAIVGVLFVLGLLVVFLSGFLITNTLQALLTQQVQQIGIMKTVGGRRPQIAVVYVTLILIFGVLAFFLAAPLAHKVSFWLLSLLAGQLNFVLQGERIVPPAVGAQAALALVMPQLAAWLPIWQGTRISVQEALSGIKQGEGEGTQREATQQGSGAARNFSRPMLIAVRNTFRRKGRLLLTLVTLTLGGAVFISTFNVQVSLSKYIEQVSQYFLSDVNVSLEQPYRIEEVQQELSQVPGVALVEGWGTARSELIQADGSAGERVQLLAPPAESKLIKPILRSGRWIQPGEQNAIVLNELFHSRYPNLKVGDTLKLKVNGKDSQWVVVGFFQLAGKNGGFSAYTNYDYLSKLVGQPGKAITFQVVAQRTGLTAREQDLLGQAIEDRLEGQDIHVADLTTGSFLTGIAGAGFATLTAFLLFLALLTALVGSIGLAGTMSMNVMERTREIGVMRAVGASDRVLMKMVLVEGMIIGMISYVLGALLAFPISKLMADGISLSLFDSPSNFGFTVTGFAIWLGVVVVLSFLASVIPARNAVRLTIREVLAYE